MESKNQANLSFNIIDILFVLKKWKMLYIVYLTMIIVITIIVAYNLPVSYKATTVMFPPKQADDFNLASQFSFAKLSGSLLSPKDDFENKFSAIFQSLSLKEDVIKTFHLVSVYKFDKGKKYFFEDILKEYDKHVYFNVSDEGMMVISVIDKDAKRSSNMANYVASKLDQMYHKLNTESAKNQRTFLEDRLSIIKNDLDSSENRMKTFQKLNSVINIEEQTKAAIEASSSIETQYLIVQQKLAVVKKIFNFDNPEIKQLELEVNALRNQRDNLYNKKTSNVFIPLVSAPDIGLQYLRLKRDLKIQETLFEFIMQQYEKAKFDEAKQTPNLLVLDSARIPDKRFKPKRAIILIMSFVLNFFLCTVVVFMLEYWKYIKTNRSDLYKKIRNLINIHDK